MNLDQTWVLILSAGKGERAGASKGLISVNGKPWIEHQIRALEQLGFKNIAVVVGHQANEYSFLKSSKVIVICNPHPELGSFSSLQAGIKYLYDNHFLKTFAGVFVLPVDVSCPRLEVFQTLTEFCHDPVTPPSDSTQDASNISSTKVLTTYPSFEGHGGHPVFLTSTFCHSLSHLDPKHPDSRLDLQMKKLGSQTREVPVDDPRVTENLNRIEDFVAASKVLKN